MGAVAANVPVAVAKSDPKGHVAVRDGDVVGATVVRTFSSGSTTYGVLSWIMVSACERGSGVGPVGPFSSLLCWRSVDALLALCYLLG